MAGFVGRGGEIRELTVLLDSSSVLLTGPRRIGKTELIRQLCQVLPPAYQVHRVNLEGVDDVVGAADRLGEQLGENSAERIATTLKRAEAVGVGVELDQREQSPWRRMERCVQRAVAAIEDGTTLLICWDEVPWWLEALENRGTAGSGRRALAWLRQLRQRDAIHERLRMILTGSVGLAGLAAQLEAAAELNDLSVVEIGPLAASDGEALFEAELAPRGLTCTEDASRHAHLRAGGSPHWIKLLAQRSRPEGDVVLPAHVDDAAEQLLSVRLRYLFDDEGRSHLVRRYGDAGARVARGLLSAAAASDEPAPQAALLSAALGENPGLTRAEAQARLYALVDDFYLREAESGFAFVNPLFRDWWRLYGMSL